jgi:hypothetical protein
MPFGLGGSAGITSTAWPQRSPFATDLAKAKLRC